MDGQSVRDMIPPLDPFALQFDSIELDPARAHSGAYDHAMALSAPSAAAPDFESAGFYLLDDAGGRFVVDREMGVVSLRDEALLQREHGFVHEARLRVVEPSGLSYEIGLKLRITGRVPQMVGADENAFGAETLSAPPSPVSEAARRRQVAWTTFTATHDAGGAPAPLRCCGATPYGTLLGAQLPAVSAASANLRLDQAPPAPSSPGAIWSI